MLKKQVVVALSKKVKPNLCFGSKTCHESSSGITSVVLLNETDGGVYHKQSDDTNKVLPIRRLPLRNHQHKMKINKELNFKK